MVGLFFFFKVEIQKYTLKKQKAIVLEFWIQF